MLGKSPDMEYCWSWLKYITNLFQFLLIINLLLFINKRFCISHRHQSFDLQCKLNDWFLYGRQQCTEMVKFYVQRLLHNRRNLIKPISLEL